MAHQRLIIKTGGGESVIEPQDPLTRDLVLDAGGEYRVFPVGSLVIDLEMNTTYTAISGDDFAIKYFTGSFVEITGGRYTSRRCNELYRSLVALVAVSPPPGFGATDRDLSAMFYHCESLATFAFPAGFGAAATNMSSMFNGCINLTEVRAGAFPAGFGAAATDISYMFYQTGLAVIRGGAFPVGFGEVATNFSWMFAMCQNLQEIRVGAFPPQFADLAMRLPLFGVRTINLENMFFGCPLTSVPAGAFTANFAESVGLSELAPLPPEFVFAPDQSYDALCGAASGLTRPDLIRLFDQLAIPYLTRWTKAQFCDALARESFQEATIGPDDLETCGLDSLDEVEPVTFQTYSNTEGLVGEDNLTARKRLIMVYTGDTEIFRKCYNYEWLRKALNINDGKLNADGTVKRGCLGQVRTVAGVEVSDCPDPTNRFNLLSNPLNAPIIAALSVLPPNQLETLRAKYFGDWRIARMMREGGRFAPRARTVLSP